MTETPRLFYYCSVQGEDLAGWLAGWYQAINRSTIEFFYVLKQAFLFSHDRFFLPRVKCERYNTNTTEFFYSIFIHEKIGKQHIPPSTINTSAFSSKKQPTTVCTQTVLAPILPGVCTPPPPSRGTTSKARDDKFSSHCAATP